MSTPVPADRYLEPDQFAVQFGRTLTDAESLVASRLLQVVSDWIRARKPDADLTAAAQVVFEVVRDALNYGGYERLSKFENTTAQRTEAGTFDESMKVVNDYLTDLHKRLLGIALRAAPRGHFVKCDY
jgi:hypothetical protein